MKAPIGMSQATRKSPALLATAGAYRESDSMSGEALDTTPGNKFRYRNEPVLVLARQMSEPFSIARMRGGDLLHGLA